MKRNAMMAVAVLSAALFTGCAKESGPGDTGPGNDPTTVWLKVKTPVRELTRGEGDRVENGTGLTVGTGHIFFTDTDGQIKRHVKIVGTVSDADAEVALSALTEAGGASITDVPTSSSKCYIFTNVPSATQTALTALNVTVNQTNISAIEALGMAVGDMKDSGYGVANVPQWGVGDVGYSGDNSKFTSTVDIYAMGSRLQVAKFTAGAAPSDGAEIVSYRIDGIFVNNYFASMPVSYRHTAADITNNLSNINKYGGSDNAYTGGLAALADFNSGFSPGLGQFAGVQTLVCTPAGTDKVWAYNVWPTAHMGGTVTSATIPHLVVRLSNVVWNDGSGGADQTIVEPRFITVKGIKAGGSPLPSIEKGMAYTFTNIAFSKDNLTTVPEESMIDAEVVGNPIDWKETDVEPEL